LAIALQIVLWLWFALIVGVVVVVAYASADAYYYQRYLGRKLEHDLGFHEGREYVRVSRGFFGLYAVVGIKKVEPEGAFAHAGIRAGDLLPGISHTDLFRRLHRHRGGDLELTVVDGGHGPPSPYERPKRIVRINVPPRRRTGKAESPNTA
jgi:hypothetical protein